MKVIEILLVEGNPADADMIHELLPTGGPVSYQAESVTRLSAALARLAGGGIDMVLLDLGLPDSQGLATLHQLRTVASEIPIIVLTGNNDQELAVAAVREGAQDYLVKGQLGSSLLVRALRYARERNRVELALHESLREKDVLLMEIHHRVKNNLQMMSSLLYLQAGHSDDPNVKALLQVMQNRVLSMALIHNHLYRSNNLETVDMVAYLKSLCEQLCHLLVNTPDTLQLHLDIAPVQLAIDQAIPCGLLVNELVTNALKHAFPEERAGELRITLQPVADGQMLRLCVADNGVGLPPDFSLEHHSSTGLQVASGLAGQLGGILQIGAGTGTLFELAFPFHHP